MPEMASIENKDTMKIKDDCFKVEQKQIIKQALIALTNQPSDKMQRPCPGCRFAVGQEHSTTTSKYCSYTCPYASKQMSADPEKYPIEQSIVPLVYAFYTLRLMMPCWSCEGHNDMQGHIFKTPKLWFYSANEFYPKLVAQFVSAYKGEGKISNHWSVRILPFSQSMFTTTYSLEPQEAIPSQTHLSSLQSDIKIIADNLREEMLKLANYYIARADKGLQPQTKNLIP